MMNIVKLYKKLLNKFFLFTGLITALIFLKKRIFKQFLQIYSFFITGLDLHLKNAHLSIEHEEECSIIVSKINIP